MNHWISAWMSIEATSGSVSSCPGSACQEGMSAGRHHTHLHLLHVLHDVSEVLFAGLSGELIGQVLLASASDCLGIVAGLRTCGVSRILGLNEVRVARLRVHVG